MVLGKTFQRLFNKPHHHSQSDRKHPAYVRGRNSEGGGGGGGEVGLQQWHRLVLARLASGAFSLYLDGICIQTLTTSSLTNANPQLYSIQGSDSKASKSSISPAGVSNSDTAKPESLSLAVDTWRDAVLLGQAPLGNPNNSNKPDDNLFESIVIILD